MIMIATACGGGPPATSTIAQPGAGAAPAGASAASPAAVCPPNIAEVPVDQPGQCFEPAVLGADVAAACGQLFAGKGWIHDTEAETAIGGRLGEKLICYRAPT